MSPLKWWIRNFITTSEELVVYDKVIKIFIPVIKGDVKLMIINLQNMRYTALYYV